MSQKKIQCQGYILGDRCQKITRKLNQVHVGHYISQVKFVTHSFISVIRTLGYEMSKCLLIYELFQRIRWMSGYSIPVDIVILVDFVSDSNEFSKDSDIALDIKIIIKGFMLSLRFM